MKAPWGRWAAPALLAYTAAFGTAFALLVPPFEAPDEPAHLAYVDFIAARAEIPNQYGPDSPLTGHGLSPTEGHQPPLYYAAAALLLRLTAQAPCMPTPPTPNPLHAWNGAGGTRIDVPMFQPAEAGARRSIDYPCLLLLRELSVLLGVLNVAAVLALAGHFFAGPWRLMPALLVATLPQFLFAAGVVSNDGLANLLITLCLLVAVRLLSPVQGSKFKVQRDATHAVQSSLGADYATGLGPYVQLGLLVGLALLAKKTALFLLPGLVALIGYIAYRHRGDRGRLVSVVVLGAAALAVAAMVCGWWFVRNRVLYGDLLGSQMEKTTLAALVQEKGLRSPYFRGQFPREFFQSLVGTFGWMQIVLPAPVYRLYALLAGLAMAGIPLWLRSPRFPPTTPTKAAFAALFVLSCLGGILVYNLTYSQPQGRFLFPVIGPLAIFVAGGLRALFAPIPLRQVAPDVAAGLVGALVFVDVVSLFSVVQFYPA